MENDPITTDVKAHHTASSQAVPEHSSNPKTVNYTEMWEKMDGFMENSLEQSIQKMLYRETEVRIRYKSRSR